MLVVTSGVSIIKQKKNILHKTTINLCSKEGLDPRSHCYQLKKDKWIVILSIYISFDHFCYDWSLLYIIPSQAAFFHLILFSTSFLFCAQHNFDGFDSKRREEMLAWKCFNGYPLWLWHDIDTNDTLQQNTQLVFS